MSEVQAEASITCYLVGMYDLEHTRALFVTSCLQLCHCERIHIDASRFGDEVDDGYASREGMSGLCGRLPQTSVDYIRSAGSYAVTLHLTYHYAPRSEIRAPE